MNSSKSSNSEPAPEPTYRIVVQPEHAGQRLDRLLGDQPQVVSREMARRLIIGGDVRINDKSLSPSTRMRNQDVVEFRIPPPQPSDIAAEAGELEVLYEDSWLIVVNKSPGIPMHPGAGHPSGTLVNRLLHHCQSLSGVGGRVRPGIVHRLDMDTSGVVVVAKNDPAHLHLASQFQERTIGRIYLALATGQPELRSGTIDLPLGRHPKHRVKRAVRQDGPDHGPSHGKRAITHWRVLRRMPPFTLFQLKLETGRTHQIRVHLNECNWPVVGDPLYGGNRWRGMQLPEDFRQVLQGFGRQALHAASLEFVHPRDGQTMRFESPMPEDMARLVELAESHAAGQAGQATQRLPH